LIEAEMRIPNQGRADEASVQDDGNHLLWDFRVLHTSFGSDGQVSPVVSERAQAAQVEVLRAQAKPGAVLKRPAPQQDLLDPLSVRELEVLQLMAQGATNQGIARALTLAIETVKRHVSNIISKLGAYNRTQAVVRAHSLGLLS
jgi:ATP/maltotriose-dependent transcriptional regulator MalT